LKTILIAQGTTSDPFCKIRYGKEKFETETVKKNLNPTWGETFKLAEDTSLYDFTIEVLHDEKKNWSEVQVHRSRYNSVGFGQVI